MWIFRKLEIEWKITLLAAVMLLAFALPIQRISTSRFKSALVQSVDPNLEPLLRSHLGPDSDPQNVAITRSIQRNRQWKALLPIIIEEQRQTIWGVVVLLILPLLAIAVWSGKRLTRPLKELAFAAGKIGAGLQAPIPRGSQGALGKLELSMTQMQDELARLRERARAQGMESAWRDIARIMAHEIKNPLTPMQLTLDRIQERIDNGAPLPPDELGKFVVRMESQVQNLERLVNDFRSFAREPEAQVGEVDLGSAVASIAETMRGRIETCISGEAKVLGDPHLLDRVLLNIWKNSMEAGASKVVVTIGAQGNETVLSIRDNGHGIAKEHLERVWIPYVTFKKGGTGLGLPVVKRLLESMKATVTMESLTDCSDRGCKVTIRFTTYCSHGLQESLAHNGPTKEES